MFRRALAIIVVSLTLASCGANAEATYQLGLQYWHGQGVPKNAPKAVEYFQKAADDGSAGAQLTLGYLYVKGEGGLEKDLGKAVELFVKAAKQGNRDGQYNAGLAYARGEGVTQSDVEALKWFVAAGEQGDGGAQYNAGVMRWNGQGDTKDPVAAHAWFTLATQAKFPGADESLKTAAATLTPDQVRESARLVAKIQAKIKRAPVASSAPPVTEPAEADTPQIRINTREL